MRLPNPSEEFTLYINASRKGLEAVLMLDRKVVVYISRKLKDYECNYPTHGLELEVSICVKEWRLILYGAQYEIFTGHESLTHLFS